MVCIMILQERISSSSVFLMLLVTFLLFFFFIFLCRCNNYNWTCFYNKARVGRNNKYKDLSFLEDSDPNVVLAIDLFDL
jgi:hypothetical protein